MKYHKQTDIRWANKAYAGSTIGRAGCGPTSVAMIVDKTPSVVAAYMTKKGYGINGQGTTWMGIKNTLEYYGYACTMHNSISAYGNKDSLAETVFKKNLKTGKHYGILLMGKSKFTSGGHYIVISKYHKSKGFYVKDPYSKNLCGWHPWSDFEGLVKIYYTIKKPTVSKSAAATVTYYKAPAKKYNSIVDALGAIGVNSLLSNRKRIAAANGIPDYSGTAAQNQKLLDKLYSGKLKQ